MNRDVLLLLALPASGKSEIRRYLDHADAATRAGLGIGAPVHVDDYPYVHIMRRAAEELVSAGEPPAFFASPMEPFIDARDWSTLTLLLDEDARCVLGTAPAPSESARALFARIDRARSAAGPGPAFAPLPTPVVDALALRLQPEASRVYSSLTAARSAWRPGATTLLVEFARGGPEGAELPLEAPLGYRHALSLLSPAVLERAAVLYVLVTPEESRRRNAERTRPGRDGDASILYHGVPESVMRADYGCDDMGLLLEAATTPNTIEVVAGAEVARLPAAVLDNRDDLTSHLRGEPEDWDRGAAEELHRRLGAALGTVGFPVQRTR